MEHNISNEYGKKVYTCECGTVSDISNVPINGSFVCPNCKTLIMSILKEK